MPIFSISPFGLNNVCLGLLKNPLAIAASLLLNSQPFLRPDLADISVVPEVGDIVSWHEDYYEVDTVRENQLFLGKDNNYNLTDYGSQFGRSISIVVDCHLTRGDKVGIAEVV